MDLVAYVRIKDIWATTRENVPSDKNFDIKETSLI